MKNRLFQIFNRTFGAFVRAIQKTMIARTPSEGLHFQVHQRAIQSTADYVEANLVGSLIFQSRPELWDYCINRVSSIQNEGNRGWVIAEFGVWKGRSINYFAKRCKNAELHGFDSFEGLQEDWSGTSLSEGAFSRSGQLPKCEKNVVLHPGWFEDTLPAFIAKLGNTQIQILHMDADTFSPTELVLKSLSKNLRSGTVIIFDEYFGYPGYNLHEFKAFHDYVKANNVEYRYLAYSEVQVAVEII